MASFQEHHRCPRLSYFCGLSSVEDGTVTSQFDAVTFSLAAMRSVANIQGDNTFKVTIEGGSCDDSMASTLQRD